MLPLFSLLPIIFATFATNQNVFINKVSAYSSLPHCAEVPLSFIVRDMASGCGDGSKTSSYSCFCTANSSKMNGVISTAVASRCSTYPTNAATQALGVFSSYCNLGAFYRIVPGNNTSPTTVNATTTVIQTVTPISSTSMSVKTVLSSIPSSSFAKRCNADTRVPIYVVLIILAFLSLHNDPYKFEFYYI